MEQDPKNLLRIVTIDIATGTTHEYGYVLTTGSGVSDIVAINDHQFLVDERDGKGLGDGSTAAVKQLFEIDLTGATDITNLTGAAATSAAVGKSLVLDLVKAFNDNGIISTQIPAKIEGLAFGQDVLLNGVLEHTLFVANDNDFVTNVAGPNRFFVFAFTDNDVPACGPTVISSLHVFAAVRQRALRWPFASRPPPAIGWSLPGARNWSKTRTPESRRVTISTRLTCMKQRSMGHQGRPRFIIDSVCCTTTS